MTCSIYLNQMNLFSLSHVLSKQVSIQHRKKDIKRTPRTEFIPKFFNVFDEAMAYFQENKKKRVFSTEIGKVKADFDIYNKRIQLFDIENSSVEKNFLEIFKELPDEKTFTKVTIFEKSSQAGKNGFPFERFSFRKEGVIPKYYGDADAMIWSYFLDEKRKKEPRLQRQDEILDGIKNVALKKHYSLPRGFSCHTAAAQHDREVASFLKKVFPEYPTPLTPEYIRKTILQSLCHFEIIRDDKNKIAAITSGILDTSGNNAEISDCATLPEMRGLGFMTYLTKKVEENVMRKYGVRSFFSLSRAIEPGVTYSLVKSGYKYKGKLVNNCQIVTGWETMNIFSKTFE